MQLTTEQQAQKDRLEAKKAAGTLTHMGDKLALMTLAMIEARKEGPKPAPRHETQAEIDAKTHYVDNHTCRVTKRKGCTCRYCF